MEEILIKTDYIKLDQFLKLSGAVQTGGQAKEMIVEGLIKVNGVKALERGKKLRNNDIIEVDGEYTFKVVQGS